MHAHARSLCPVVLAVAALTVLPGLSEPPALPAWRILASPDRAVPNRPLPAKAEARLFAARGEYQSFQIAIPSPPSGFQLVDADCSDLTGAQNQHIASSNVTLYREHYVNVDAASPDRHGTNRSLGPGWYPDALIPSRNPKTGKPLAGQYRAVPFRAESPGILVLWVDVFVPRGTPAGQYHASITLTSDRGKMEVPWSLNVWGFDIPPKPSLHSSFAYWNTVSRDAVEELLRHRLMPQHIAASPSASLDRALASAGGLTMTDAGYWSGADNSHCTMKPPPAVKDLLATVAAHDPGISLFNYTADEVQNCRNLYPALQAWARNLHEAHIKNLVVMAPNPQLSDDGTGRSAVDIWVVLPEDFEKSSAALAAVRTHGNEVWSYNALVQDSYSPKWLIDYDPIGYRLQAGFLSQTYGLTGLLYWRIDRWDGDPWMRVNNEGAFNSSNYPGDGMLVYPGEPAGLPGSVVPSLRLKQLRDGEQDFEYVELLKHMGRGDWALEKIRSVAGSWSNWTRSSDALENVRRQLGAEIERLSTAGH